MHKKDFLQKQIEEFGKVLAMIMGFKKNGDWQMFERQLAEVSLHFTGLHIHDLVNQNISDFESELISKEGISLDQKKIIADLLFEKLDQFLMQNEQQDFEKLKQKCILLYEHIHHNFTTNEFDLNVHYKLDALRRMD